jgi:hypothetical protein
MSPSSTVLPPGMISQRRLGVGPGLNPGPDSIVRVGRDRDLLPGKRHVVNLAAGIVTLEHDRVAFVLGKVHRVPADGCGKVGVGQFRGG